jgi:hypothetical protein
MVFQAITYRARNLMGHVDKKADRSGRGAACQEVQKLFALSGDPETENQCAIFYSNNLHML